MSSMNYTDMLANLEEQELSSEEGPSANLYTQMMALYILTDDMPSANMLWKRIPAILKQPDSDLVAVWRIASLLIKRNLGCEDQVYQLIRNRPWPPFMQKIISSIGHMWKERMINLISTAYSDICIVDVARMTGCQSDQETLTLVSDLGWTFNPATGIVSIPKTPSGRDSTVPAFGDSFECQDDDLVENISHDHLGKLTQYVSFLENH